MHGVAWQRGVKRLQSVHGATGTQQGIMPFAVLHPGPGFKARFWPCSRRVDVCFMLDAEQVGRKGCSSGTMHKAALGRREIKSKRSMCLAGPRTWAVEACGRQSKGCDEAVGPRLDAKIRETGERVAIEAS